MVSHAATEPLRSEISSYVHLIGFSTYILRNVIDPLTITSLIIIGSQRKEHGNRTRSFFNLGVQRQGESVRGLACKIEIPITRDRNVHINAHTDVSFTHFFRRIGSPLLEDWWANK